MLKEILDKYLLGETSLEEEKTLREYFTKTPMDRIPEELREYVPMFCFFSQEKEELDAIISCTKGKSSEIQANCSLDKKVVKGSHSGVDEAGLRHRIRVRAIYYISFGAVAASLAIGLFLYAFSGRTRIEVVVPSEEYSYMQMMVDGERISDEVQAKEFAQSQMQKITKLMSPGVSDVKLGVFRRVILRAENRLGEMGIMNNTLGKSSDMMKKMVVKNYEQE